MKHKLSFLISFTFLLLLIGKNVDAQVAQVTASVDKTKALIDESIQLTVSTTGKADRDDIDFSALQQDFRVSQPSYSQSTQIVNGNMSRNMSWSLYLFPKSTGIFKIPSFTIQGQSSEAFQVEILPLDAINNNRAREFYVSADLDNSNIYLQQQILYTVKIYLSRDIQRGQLSMPQLEGALIEQVGEDIDSQEVVDGVRYRIIERNYAIIPQASGEFNIEGPIFEAEVPTDSRRSFANFGRSKKITRSAPSLSIEVKPMPDNYNYTWLPTELVELSEEWQGDATELVVGEPITRTVTLTALGITKEQLPKLDLPYHPSFKVYPEQANLTTLEHKNSLIAQGVFNSAIIPENIGEFVLPEIRVPWFNVKTGKTKFALIPARSVKVVANPNAIEQSAMPIANANPQQVSGSVNANMPLEQKTNNSIFYALIGSNILTLCALLFLIIHMFMRKESNSRKNKKSDNKAPINNEEQAFKTLKSSLEQGKTEHLPYLLNTWLTLLLARQHFSISASLSLQPHTKALEKYNVFLKNVYTEHSPEFECASFIKALQEYRDLTHKSSKGGVYKALYQSCVS